MSRERVREEFEKWARPDYPDWAFERIRAEEADVPERVGEYQSAALESCWQAFQAGERLGREDSDSVYWPALCEQWKIEFGKELRQEGGHIMCVIDGARELVRDEREECARLAETRFEVTEPSEYRQGSIDTIAEISAAIRARGVAPGGG